MSDDCSEATKRLWDGFPSKTWTAPAEWDSVVAAVSEGADVTAHFTHPDRSTPTSGLVEALIRHAPLRVVKAMVEAGGDAKPDEDGWTTLHWASLYNAPHSEDGLQVAKYLVSKGVDPTKRDPNSGDFPVHWAAAAGNVPILRYWIEDTGVHPEVTNVQRETPLHSACSEDHLDATGYLVICANAFLFAKTKWGRTALQRATGDSKLLMELWNQPFMQTIIKAWRHDGTPPTSVSPDMYDKLFHPDSPGKARLSVLQFIARHHQTNLTVRCVMAGMTGVGKTTLVSCAMTGTGATVDAGEAGRTQGLDVSHQRLDRGTDAVSGDRLPMCSIMWQDFGGHSEYWALEGSFFGKTCIVFLCVDLSRVQSDSDAALCEFGLWLDGIGEQVDWEGGSSSVGLVVVGTRADVLEPGQEPVLLESVRQVVDTRLKRWSSLHGEVTKRHRRRMFDTRFETGEAEETKDTDMAGAGAGAGAGTNKAGAGAGTKAGAGGVITASSTNSPVHLLALCAVSSTTNSASLHQSFQRPDAPSVTNVHSLLCYLLHVAPEHLPGYFGHDQRPSTIRASERLLSKSAADRVALFGGKWVLPWNEFVKVAPSSLGLADTTTETELHVVTEYLESVGAVVTFSSTTTTSTPSWVVVAPTMLGNAISAVMNHRFVGAGPDNMDAATTQLVKSEECPPAQLAEIEAERAEMGAVLDAAVAAGAGTKAALLHDEAMFVSRHSLSRRYLTYVLLHPSRRRCKLTTPPSDPEELGAAVWEALEVLEYGVPLASGQTMLLPYLASLHYVLSGTTPIPSSIPLGVGVGDGSEMAAPDALSTSWAMERRLRVARLPRTLFSSILRTLVLADVVEWDLVEVTGGLVHLASRAPVPGTKAVEHIAVWLEASVSKPIPTASAPPAPAPPSGPPAPTGRLQADFHRHLVALHSSPCVIHVRSWYESCSTEVLAGLCWGFGSSFRHMLPWQGLCWARRVVCDAASELGLTVSDQVMLDVSTGVWQSLEEIRSHVMTEGWSTPIPLPGMKPVPVAHCVPLEDLPGVTNVARVSKGAFYCRRCLRARTIPVPAVCPPSSLDWEIDPGSLGPLKLIARGGFGEVLQSTWEGRPVVVKSVLPDAKDVPRQTFFLAQEGRLVRSLRHCNVVSVMGVCSRTAPLRVVMEYVDGGSLTGWLSTAPPPGRRCLAAGLRVLLGVSRGMAHVHSVGVVHFDLKPDNVLVTREGDAKVADFGLARCFKPTDDIRGIRIHTTRRGTPDFTAPELQTPDAQTPVDVTPMVDVWSFGVVADLVLRAAGEEALARVRHLFDGHEFVGLCKEVTARYRPTFAELHVQLEVVLEEVEEMKW